MLDKLFLQVLNMSFTASFIIVFVLIARLFLQKAPKIFSYALWSVVLFRLICPFSFESVFSILPTKANPIPAEIGLMETPQIDTGIPAINQSINTILPQAAPAASSTPLQIWIFVGEIIWLLGLTTLLVYSFVSLYKLTRTLTNAVSLRENIYCSDQIGTAFVLGVFHPKIYLPQTLCEKEQKYILLHEQTHIKRLDHLIKLFAFIILCVHWFNPFVWISFFSFSKDMELSCDEAVIKTLGNDVKKEYSSSLLSLATGRRIIGGTPLAFGEGNTKSRVKNVLNYKRPAFWVIVASVILLIVVGFGLVSNPKQSDTTNANYSIMTDETEAISCEYGINKDYQLDTLEMLSALERLKGFTFDTDWAAHGYIKFVFPGKTPQDIFLRYCSDVDNIWQQEYPINSANYQIKVPQKPGKYSFFADITWKSGERETAYFSITVVDAQEGSLASSKENSTILTQETANELIRQTLSTFQLNSDDTVSFTLPAEIPVDETGKTKLYISSSATFLPVPGTSSIQEFLDWDSDWQGGETFSAQLDMSKGTLTELFLRVAFMTEQGENVYQEYAADYIKLTEPFSVDSPVEIADRNVEIQEGANTTVLYTMQNGHTFSVTLALPAGITLATTDHYPEYASSPDYEMPTIVVLDDESPIGTLKLYEFGTNDQADLSQINTAENTMPIAIFATVENSNHAEYENYKVQKFSSAGANATAKYAWQDLTNYAGDAPDAPWLKSDCVLAYDYNNAPFFLELNLTENVLTPIELEDIAKSIVITN